MKPQDSPFPCRWESFALEEELGDLRPRISTYARYDFYALPPLPFELRGDWGWLLERAPVDRCIGGQSIPMTTSSFDPLKAEAASAGLTIPDDFVRFLFQPALPERVRSNTDCILDLSPGLATPPSRKGYLIRFLADSQGCLYWYLYLTPEGESAVVSSFTFYGTRLEEEQYYGSLEHDARKSESLSFAEESFERFICRFWIENEIWYARFEDRDVPDFGRQYLEAYRKGQ